VDRQLVGPMVAVARGLGKETVAEFVSDADTVKLLREYGVDYVQGLGRFRRRRAGSGSNAAGRRGPGPSTIQIRR